MVAENHRLTGEPSAGLLIVKKRNWPGAIAPGQFLFEAALKRERLGYVSRAASPLELRPCRISRC
jgi:hypothetical protein